MVLVTGGVLDVIASTIAAARGTCDPLAIVTAVVVLVTLRTCRRWRR